MSLQIIKAGILDTIQDLGRYGYQHLGINPGGAMDKYSAQLANALLGKDLNAPVIELHFPASQILFEKETIICITGADFSPTINSKKNSLNQPVAVEKNSVLHFEKIISGARCYLSLIQNFELEKWLGSYSTNLKAQAGGHHGRALKKGDVINFQTSSRQNNILSLSTLKEQTDFKKINDLSFPFGGQGAGSVRFIKANEYDWLTDESKINFEKEVFNISNNSDRMGYRLKGNELRTKNNEQLISSAVTFGTIQLLPDGQSIVLMADHQTTGGYPRIANVISTDLPILAQKKPGDEIMFVEAEQNFAEQQLMEQQKYLQHIQTTCKLKFEN